ncbi:MAG: phospholipid/cholesterol/gamma-HCH transport system substrate-binding protein [Actinomycetota bacterium]|jgi:phospholipid/cholesterol/gamma-HCH transport system substrate-binding protein|nr:phospholipid/cholesterol/gamma-HCH transport system substrate-binding protein [Actinomycetota bacterium]
MKRVGAFVVVMGVLVSSAACSGDKGPTVVAYFRDAGDLVSAAEVQLSDVAVGTVKSIEAVRDGSSVVAKVTMELDPAAQVPAEDLTALVRQTSLLGEQFVELLPGTHTGPYVGADGVEIPVERTDRRVDIETFLSDLSGFIGGGGLTDLNQFTHAQAMIIEGRGQELGESIEQLEMFTGILADRRGDISSAIDQLASAGTELAANMGTLNRFFDSLEDANVLLADESDGLRRLISSFRRFGTVNARFLAAHEDSINRGFKALRPILAGLADTQGELRIDITQLALFLELFPKSIGGGPGDKGSGDYIQADAIVCEVFSACHTNGGKGDVAGEGS